MPRAMKIKCQDSSSSGCGGHDRICGLAITALLLTMLPATVTAGAVFEDVKGPQPKPTDYLIKFAKTAAKGPVVPVQGAGPYSNDTLTVRSITFESCGTITPHLHPRGTENIIVLQGEFQIDIFPEGATANIQSVKVSPGQGVIVPQGFVHATWLLGCGKGRIITVFDHHNPGTVFVGPSLASLNRDVVNSAFGGEFPADNGRFVTAAGCDCGDVGPAPGPKDPPAQPY